MPGARYDDKGDGNPKRAGRVQRQVIEERRQLPTRALGVEIVPGFSFTDHAECSGKIAGEYVGSKRSDGGWPFGTKAMMVRKNDDAAHFPVTPFHNFNQALDKPSVSRGLAGH
jgi:hypothetical protein